MELVNKLVIITGASRGIGRVLAKELAGCGCNLLLTALEPDELNELLNELEALPITVSILAADLTDSNDRTHLIHWIMANEQPPDILVNNVGMGGRFGRFEDIDLNNIERTVALNISSLIQLTHELIPVLRQRPHAKIMNISSGIARLPYPGLAVYGATKGFISSFSESLACELADSTIDVHCFYPGFTSTRFMESSGMDMRRIPRWMIHTPESVARRIVKALRKDYKWYYSDFSTKILPVIGSLIPHGLKIQIFKNLFWELPNDTQ